MEGEQCPQTVEKGMEEVEPCMQIVETGMEVEPCVQVVETGMEGKLPLVDNGLIVGDSVEVVDDKVNDGDDDNKTGEPKPGMKFDTADEMFEFYRNYAKEMGFPVRRRSSRKDDDGMLKWVTYTCSRGGRSGSTSKNPLKTHSNMRTGCKGRLTGCLEIEDGRWRIGHVILEHNHELSPSRAQYFRCNRDKNAKKHKNNDLVDVHGNGASLEKDDRSSLEKARRLRLEEGDCFALQDYFSKMQTQSTGFFYSIDLDEEGRIKNVFWADGRSREAYKEFDDVVTFDTTCLASKYDIPLTTFIGFDHHGQSILFGCGLISSEDTYTFSWLFRSWLACMSQCAPNGIITNQDEAIQKAIETVFPNTRHSWCLWHVMKNLSAKISGCNQHESVSLDLQGAVYDSQEPAEFEQSWNAIVDMHGLHNNEWLNGLYNERHRWVPCFVRTSFWAGMSSTKRVDHMNVVFDGCVNSKTSIKEFLEQYVIVLRYKVEKEIQSVSRPSSQQIPCVTCYEMERQIQAVYTISKFKEFQQELTGKMYCEFSSIREDYMVSEYNVREDVLVGSSKKRMIFTVSFRREDCEVKCSCHMFEFKGILCKHAINVLIRNDVLIIPEKYILWRWRKDVRRHYTRVKMNFVAGVAALEQSRYDNLCSAFAKVADLAAEGEGSYVGAMKWIDSATNELLLKKQINTR